MKVSSAAVLLGFLTDKLNKSHKSVPVCSSRISHLLNTFISVRISEKILIVNAGDARIKATIFVYLLA